MLRINSGPGEPLKRNDDSELPAIEGIVILGDSLSDRGTLAKRKLFGIIPMGLLSGLKKSPRGSFTNGNPWSSALASQLICKFFIRSKTKSRKKQLGDQHIQALDLAVPPSPLYRHHSMNAGDLADAVAQNPLLHAELQRTYTLDDANTVKYKDRDFIRSKAEGGATAYDYKWWPSSSIKRFFSRLILSNLSNQRNAVLEDDRKRAVDREQKKKTLVIEWSGANDFITVNKEPSEDESTRILEERIKNIKEMVANGYCNFVLFNMPNLALTPRYQNTRTQAERNKAANHCLDFNIRLEIECSKLQAELRANHPGLPIKIEIFDVASVFQQAFDNPESMGMGFKSEKKTTPFVESKDFVNKDGRSPSKGYMFWDDVHPTADMHALLAQKFSDKYQQKFDFDHAPREENAEELVEKFKKIYKQTMYRQSLSLFSSFRNFIFIGKLENQKNPELALALILKHAFFEDGKRSKEIIKQLGWFDENGELCSHNHALKKAKAGQLVNKAALKAKP